MKNLEKKVGFLNRHTDGIPYEIVTMRIVTNDIDGEHIDLCEWRPFKPESYTDKNMPSKGYMGTARIIQKNCIGIGFNAWEQNDSEFVYYSLV